MRPSHSQRRPPVPELCLERDRSWLAGFFSSCAHPPIEIKRYFCDID
jgi:hypothetical protein